MWTIAIWFFAFLFAINGMMVYISDALPAYSLVSPITNTTITPAPQPTPTTTLIDINGTSSTGTNSTGGAGVGIWETAEYAWNSTIFVINLLTGGFIFQAIAVFGLPVLFLNVVQGLIAFFMIITVLHFWRGIF